MVDKGVTTQAGWFDTLKEKLNPTALMEKLRLSKDKLIEIALYGGIGFLVGFLLKKFSWYVFVFVLAVVGFIALQQFGLVNVVVNWDKVYEVFGIQPVTVTGDTMFAMFFEWVKANVLITVSFVTGFIIGLKLG